jgi:hypothetical protein
LPGIGHSAECRRVALIPSIEFLRTADASFVLALQQVRSRHYSLDGIFLGGYIFDAMGR